MLHETLHYYQNIKKNTNILTEPRIKFLDIRRNQCFKQTPSQNAKWRHELISKLLFIIFDKWKMISVENHQKMTRVLRWHTETLGSLT